LERIAALRKFLLFLFIFCQVLVCSLASGQDAGANFWDFGKIKQGQRAEHVFTFRNDSKSELNISGTNATCGCTASNIDKQKLLPGESANLRVAFNSHGYEGEVRQFVYVNTDSPDKGVVKFTIKANVAK